jgi:autotransporter-associated beta strand protein
MSGITFARNINLNAGGTLSGAGNAILNGVVTVAGAAGVTLDSGSSSSNLLRLDSYTGGSGSTTTVTGAGTVMLGFGNPGYSGGWQVNSGTLRLLDSASLGTGTSAIPVSGTLLLSGVILNRNVTLNNGGTFAGVGSTGTGVVTVAGAANVSLDSGSISSNALTISAYSGGSGSATQVTGFGTVVLSAANSYAGGWTIGGGGALRLQHADALGTGTSAVIVGTGSILDLDEVSITRSITINDGGFLRGRGTSGAAGTVTIPSDADVSLLAIPGSSFPPPTVVLAIGNLTGGGGGSSISVTAGKVVTQPNSYVGDWNVTGGTLEIDSDAELGDAANTVTLDGGALATTATFSSARAFAIGSFGGRIDSAGTFTLSSALPANANAFTSGGTGTLILTSVSSRTGSSTINNGVLRLNQASALGSGTATVSSSGVLEVGTGVVVSMPLSLGQGGTLRAAPANAVQYTGTITAANSANALTLDSGTFSLTLSAYAGGTGSNTIVSGSGLLSLPNSNSYSGGWQVNGGTLRAGNATSLGGGASAVVVNSGAILELGTITLARAVTLNNNATLRAFAAAANTTEPTTIASAAAVTLASSSSAFTIGDSANDLTGGGGGSTVSVQSGLSGKVVLNQTSNYTGNWTIGVSSTLEIDGDDRLGNAANTLALNGGRLRAVGTFASNRAISNGPAAGKIEVTAGNTLTLNGGLGGSSAHVTKEGDGTLVLAASSARSGDTNIIAGTVRLADASAAGSGFVSVFNAAAVEIANVTVGNSISLLNTSMLRGTGTATVSESVTVTGSPNITLATGNSASDVLTLSGTPSIGGTSGSLTIAGSGTVALSTSNTYTGAWNLASGVLQMGADNRLGNVANSVTFDGGTLRTSAAVTSARNIAVNAAGGGTIDTNGFNSTFSGAITGAGTLSKTSGGTLSVTNVRAGGLSVNGGILKLTAVANPANSAAVTAGVSNVSSLAITATGTVNLTNNRIITNDAQGTESSGIYSGVQGMVQSDSIFTDEALAAANQTAIGVATAAESKGLVGAATTLWSGQTVDSNDTLVMYTWAGDANLDGKVNADDYASIDLYSTIPGSDSWNHGDFNYNGTINADDYALIDNNVQNVNYVPYWTTDALRNLEGGGSAMPALTAVPEPALTGICILLVPLMRRVRRSRI